MRSTPSFLGFFLRTFLYYKLNPNWHIFNPTISAFLAVGFGFLWIFIDIKLRRY